MDDILDPPAICSTTESGLQRRSAGADDLEALVSNLWDKILLCGPAARGASILDLKVGVRRVHRLFVEIEKATGVALPITVMFQAHTIDKLVDVLRQRAAPPSEPLALMRPGKGASALFVFPGVGGMALELFDMGRLIRHSGPIYANQPNGLDAKVPPDQTVAGMAAYQYSLVRTAQPQGPYCLLGFSVGGLVAIEVARLLVKTGENVAFLGLMEPTLPECQWPAPVKRAFLLKRIRTHVATLRALPSGEALGYVFARAKPTLNRLRRFLGSDATLSASPYHLEGLPAELANVRDASLAAFYAYEPKYYPGNAIFFDSEEGDPLSCRPLQVFPQYMRGYEHFTCSGNHSSMVRQPHVWQLADQISTCLAKVDLSR